MKLGFLCKVLPHKPGIEQPAVGGRNVVKCLRCETVISEKGIELKEVKHLARSHRPQGRQSDTWPKQ